MGINGGTLFSSELIKAQALALGFNRIGLIRAEPARHLNAYLRWIEAGLHGEMGYLARPDRLARRRDLNVILPGVRTLILVGLDYSTLRLPDSLTTDPRRGRVASYAWGADYHVIMTPRLEQLAAWISAQTAQPITQRVYVDTGAVLERDHGQQAGLGFIGKNTLLIDPRRGSYFFLGEILTTLEVDHYDIPARETLCGTCQRCQMACPTNAFPQPYVLDARRCISYLTIEYKGVLDQMLVPLMDNWVYGCDVCQAVCPWNRFAIQTHESSFYPLSLDRAAPLLSELLTLDEPVFKARFDGSAIARIGRDRLVRNACIAAGNSHLPEFAPALDTLATDPNPAVASAAEWARAQLQAR